MKQINLDNWTPFELQLAVVEPQAEPEPHVVLMGTCFGHPLKEDGAEISTGKIAKVFVEGECIIAQTVTGTEYVLGEPDKKYAAEDFPNAREQIIQWSKTRCLA